jgi:enoyl-CoA hydratase
VGLAGTQVGITETKVGRGSPWAVPLLWMLPQPLVMEMVLTGDLYPVERFVQLGFVNHLEPDTAAVRAPRAALAERIRDNAPLSVRRARSR